MSIPRQHLNWSPALLFFDFSGTTEEDPQTKQLEFEDVWLASQVEPLKDNFDILGRFALGQAIRQENKQKVSNLIRRIWACEAVVYVSFKSKR